MAVPVAANDQVGEKGGKLALDLVRVREAHLPRPMLGVGPAVTGAADNGAVVARPVRSQQVAADLDSLAEPPENLPTLTLDLQVGLAGETNLEGDRGAAAQLGRAQGGTSPAVQGAVVPAQAPA
jgi:hypothetical protein